MVVELPKDESNKVKIMIIAPSKELNDNASEGLVKLYKELGLPMS